MAARAAQPITRLGARARALYDIFFFDLSPRSSSGGGGAHTTEQTLFRSLRISSFYYASRALPKQQRRRQPDRKLAQAHALGADYARERSRVILHRRPAPAFQHGRARSLPVANICSSGNNNSGDARKAPNGAQKPIKSSCSHGDDESHSDERPRALRLDHLSRGAHLYIARARAALSGAASAQKVGALFLAGRSRRCRNDDDACLTIVN